MLNPPNRVIRGVRGKQPDPIAAHGGHWQESTVAPKSPIVTNTPIGGVIINTGAPLCSGADGSLVAPPSFVAQANQNRHCPNDTNAPIGACSAVAVTIPLRRRVATVPMEEAWHYRDDPGNPNAPIGGDQLAQSTPNGGISAKCLWRAAMECRSCDLTHMSYNGNQLGDAVGQSKRAHHTPNGPEMMLANPPAGKPSAQQCPVELRHPGGAGHAGGGATSLANPGERETNTSIGCNP